MSLCSLRLCVINRYFFSFACSPVLPPPHPPIRRYPLLFLTKIFLFFVSFVGFAVNILFFFLCAFAPLRDKKVFQVRSADRHFHVISFTNHPKLLTFNCNFHALLCVWHSR